MKTQCQDSDRISALPENIIESILSLLPIRDALRTSVLSKKWQYSWRGMPKLVFTNNMVKVPFDCGYELEKYKLVSAIFHVLLLHNGPTILKFACSVGHFIMDSEFAQIFSYLVKGNKVKELIFCSDNVFYKLPISFFSLQGLELIHLERCTFEPPLIFNRFSRLKSMKFYDVNVSAQMLQRFLSKCPLLENISLRGYLEDIDFVAGGNQFTFVDLFQCVRFIRSLNISIYYMKYLSAGGMPRKLPTTPVHLRYVVLDVCMTEKNEVSSALCLIRSSPLLVKIKLRMYGNETLHGQENSTNFLKSHDYSDVKVEHLEILEIEMLHFFPLVTDFVKFIMANSPKLKKVQISLHLDVSFDEELKMVTDLVGLPLPRASPSAELIIKRPQTSF